MAYLSILVLAFFLIAQGNAAASIYAKLYEYVISQSDGVYVPPVTEVGKPVEVGAQMGIIGITDVDRESNTVDLVFMFSTTWNSTILWDPAQFNGLTMITLSRNDVWSPKIGIRNAARIEPFGSNDVVLMAHGLAGGARKYKATIQCDLSSGNKCLIQAASTTYYNKVVAFQEPENLFLKIENSLGPFRHVASPFPVTGSRNVKSTVSFEGLPDQADMITLEFSFRDPHRHHRHD